MASDTSASMSTHPYLHATRLGARKLQLGCGENYLAERGWLDTDFAPQADHVLLLDASQTFPFPDESFDYVYSEHMIEHMTYTDGANMLSESFRVMRPGARIRITCPDIEFLLGLYVSASPLHKAYSDWSCAEVTPWAPFSDPVFTINNYVRAWGHQFIYSKALLAESMRRAGFDKVEEFSVGSSGDPELCGLEVAERPFYQTYRQEFLQLESMTLEAVKPHGIDLA